LAHEKILGPQDVGIAKLLQIITRPSADPTSVKRATASKGARYATGDRRDLRGGAGNKQRTTEKAAPASDAAKVSSDANRDVKSKRTERHVGGRYAGYRHGPLYNSYRGDGWYYGCHRHRLMPWLWC
jgi:hypothetical protein